MQGAENAVSGSLIKRAANGQHMGRVTRLWVPRCGAQHRPCCASLRSCPVRFVTRQPPGEVTLEVVWCFNGAEDYKRWIVCTSKLNQGDLF